MNTDADAGKPDAGVAPSDPPPDISQQELAMIDDRKPMNPLERQENSGIADGSRTPIAEGRHGLDADVLPEDVEREKAKDTAVTDARTG